MQADLRLSPSQWGWALGMFTLAYALFEIPGGALADRIGPRKVLTRIVLWWSAFTAITGFVSGFNSLLLVRFLFGAGEAGAFPNCTSTISRWIPLEERGRAQSAVFVATGVGGALTPLLVVPIQQAYGWRAAFWIFAVCGVVWAAVWYLWFRDSPAQMTSVSAEEQQLIGHHPQRGHEPAPWRQFFSSRNFLAILFMYHTYCWGAYFYLSWLPTYLQKGRGLTENQMKLASALPSCAGVAGILLGGFLSDWLARRFSLRIARCSISSGGLIASGVLVLLAANSTDNRVSIALMAVGLGFMNLMLPISWTVCLDVAGRHAGAVSGAMNMAGQMGSFLSTIAFGYLVEYLGSYDLAILPLASMLIVSGCAYLFIDPAQKLVPIDQVLPFEMKTAPGSPR